MVDFAVSGFDIDPEKLGLTAEARFQIEKVVATDESIKSSIQRMKPIKERCDELYGDDKITYDNLKIAVALLIRQFGVTDGVVRWTPEKMEELRGEYPKEGGEEGEEEVTRIPDTPDFEDEALSQNSTSSDGSLGKRKLPEVSAMRKKMKTKSLFK